MLLVVSKMSNLKLAALDEEDLSVLSAHLQDAVAKVGDVEWHPRDKKLILQLNRFVWEKAEDGRTFERRRACLHFSRVEAVKAVRIRQDARDAVISILAVRFEATDPPAGRIYLDLAGGGCLRLEVECIEAGLADLGAAWSTEHRPDHAL